MISVRGKSRRDVSLRDSETGGGATGNTNASITHKRQCVKSALNKSASNNLIVI